MESWLHPRFPWLFFFETPLSFWQPISLFTLYDLYDLWMTYFRVHHLYLHNPSLTGFNLYVAIIIDSMVEFRWISVQKTNVIYQVMKHACSRMNCMQPELVLCSTTAWITCFLILCHFHLYLCPIGILLLTECLYPDTYYNGKPAAHTYIFLYI